MRESTNKRAKQVSPILRIIYLLLQPRKLNYVEELKTIFQLCCVSLPHWSVKDRRSKVAESINPRLGKPTRKPNPRLMEESDQTASTCLRILHEIVILKKIEVHFTFNIQEIVNGAQTTLLLIGY